jgi:O-methyltransferase
MSGKDTARKQRLYRFWRMLYDTLSMPVALFYLTFSRKVHGSYGMNWFRRILLGFRFFRNYHRITSGTSWRAHLVMGMRLLEIPPDVEGDVVECGCWKGGATVNLSIVCAIVGRKLKVYDSFEGLPPPTEGDHIAQRSFRNGFIPGVYGGALEEVTENVRRLGAVEVCSFHKGWFKDSLVHHEGAIAMAFWDVDYYASLHDCLLGLWPHLNEGAYLFLDEYRNVAYCSVFFSEKYWDKYFSTVPPGLIGIGTGVQVGMFFTDPSVGMGNPALQYGESIGYARKGDRSIWDYYPDEMEHATEEGSADTTA